MLCKIIHRPHGHYVTFLHRDWLETGRHAGDCLLIGGSSCAVRWQRLTDFFSVNEHRHFLASVMANLDKHVTTLED